MKKNRGITIITLVITIIVIVLISSITIYSGINAIDSIRKKGALNNTNAIYLALIANDNIIPSDNYPELKLSECTTTAGERLSNEDFKLLGLDYTTDDCTVTFDKIQSGEYTVIYTFTYTDNLKNTYSDIQYSYEKEKPKTTSVPEFDNVNMVNRPVLNYGMIPINYSGENVTNIYTEKWYNYEKGVSHLAMMKYDDEIYAWIPRFAYKIQSFYNGKSYDAVPATALDIVFLRENSYYMVNGEVLPSDFTIHPAFKSGENELTGFWIMIDSSVDNADSISDAISNTYDISINGIDSHLMNNSEYVATVFMEKYLGNNEVTFGPKEYVGAIFEGVEHKFDTYSIQNQNPNYFLKVRGHGFSDTPWNIKKDVILPDNDKNYLVRDVNNGGYFYYEAVESDGASATYRRVIPE